MKALAAAVFLLAALSADARASASGDATLSFLTLDTGARPVALGGAFTAQAAGADALGYNPAGLARTERHEASLMHNEYVQGVRQEHAAYADPAGWGAVFDYLDSGAVPRTTVSNPDGTGLGSAGLSDFAAGAGYARRFGAVSAGAAARIVRESIDGITAQTAAFDAGVQAAVPPVPGLRLGAALLHAGSDVRFVADHEPLPLTAAGGASYELKPGGQPLIFSADVRDQRGDGVSGGFGAELWVRGALALRAGYSTRYDAGPGITAGFGWRAASFQLDYAVVPFGDLGLVNRISATLRWGAAREPEQADAKAAARSRTIKNNTTQRFPADKILFGN